MDVLAALLPRIDGFLPLVFFVLLVSLTGIVGLFALYVIAQQFRNPGRRNRRA
ncbi:MAG TPA: hypothetical protein VLA82_10295 [Actinomycetota bacterium]|nr:hypothetical protein [Actinomycetota bacterium]